MGKGEVERRTGVVMPDFRRIDPVPVADLAGCQQKVYGRAGAAPRFGLVPPGFPVPAAFGMGLQLQQLDDPFRRQPLHQKLSLRARTSAKTSTGSALDSPSACARAGSSARRKGLVSTSSPRSEGTVGSLRARRASMSAARARSFS